jgi:putative Holliday junction resolvase
MQEYTLLFGDFSGEVTVVRIMGLDVGSVRIGVAVSDETAMIARGLETLTRKSWERDLEQLSQLIIANEVKHIVVGNPLNMDGNVGRQAELVRQFIERLQKVTNVAIELWDERFSSTSAERVLIEGGMQRNKRKLVIDKLAAVIILQNFLDHRNSLEAGKMANEAGGDTGN